MEPEWSTSTRPPAAARPRREIVAAHRTGIALAIVRTVLVALVATCVLAFPTRASASEPQPFPIDLDLLARILETRTRSVDDVAGTRVDYRALREDPEWARLVDQFRSARPGRLDRDGRLAFWINAYNVFAIDLVRRHYPVESIRDIGWLLSPVWNVEVATIEGESVSLGGIEHEILRPMGEPRIHAAIVCASTSCPSLAREPYRPDRIDADLDAAMRRWLASEEKGVAIDRARNTIRLSRIFDWFAEDFGGRAGVLETVAAHLPQEEAAWIRREGADATIRHLEYDWSLNDLRGEEATARRDRSRATRRTRIVAPSSRTSQTAAAGLARAIRACSKRPVARQVSPPLRRS